MLREKSKIHPHEYSVKMGFGQPIFQPKTCKKRVSMVEPGKDAEHGPHRKHIVKVSYDIIGVV